MSIDVVEYYNRGMSWDEFVSSSQKNVDRMRAMYEAFELDDDTAAFFNNRSPMQVLAIGEDWCPDVVQNLAVLARICDDVPGLELSILRRDENPELMDAYVTDGKRRIPVVAFFDSTFEEMARWAGRCASAQAWIDDEVLRGRAWSDLSDDERAAFHAEYDRRFLERYVHDTIGEWMMLLEDEAY